VNPNAQPSTASEELQAWRPHHHYTPAKNWMNDPNGLFYLDGLYHLYYQYNPAGSQWDNMSWGHATSPDLMTWSEHEVAITATPERMVFSGTVVVDHDNVSGFAPTGNTLPPILAFYTAFRPASLIQCQHLAYSLDGGYHFTDYPGNPVLDIQSTEFRDPKVFWHAPSGHWVMLVVAALQQKVWFYTSHNLLDWEKVSSFGPWGSANGNIWEVPDLFELPVDGDSLTTRWVLIVSVNRGSLWGGSGVQYFTGHFDGQQFTADDTGLTPALPDNPESPRDMSQVTLWADHGRDFYAPISFANMPDDRRVWMGWMNNWDYAAQVPTEVWRGQMSAPRQLDLVTTTKGLRLRQRPVQELTALSCGSVLFDCTGSARALAVSLAQARIGGHPLHISIRVALNALQGVFGLQVFAGEGASVAVGFDPDFQTFFVDRRSTVSQLSAGQERHAGQRVSSAPEVTLDIWIDGCALEVYGDDGTVVISDLVFMPERFRGVQWLGDASNSARVTLKVCAINAPEHSAHPRPTSLRQPPQRSVQQ
jgi:sucrose-6-phosphate hydrolase SacC (GH32 family)